MVTVGRVVILGRLLCPSMSLDMLPAIEVGWFALAWVCGKPRARSPDADAKLALPSLMQPQRVQAILKALLNLQCHMYEHSGHTSRFIQPIALTLGL